MKEPSPIARRRINGLRGITKGTPVTQCGMSKDVVVVVDSFDAPHLAARCPADGHVVSGPEQAHALGRASGDCAAPWLVVAAPPTQTAFLSGLLSAWDDRTRTPCIAFLSPAFNGDLRAVPAGEARRTPTLRVCSGGLRFPVFGRAMGAGRASTLPLALARLSSGGAEGAAGVVRTLTQLPAGDSTGGLRRVDEAGEGNTGAIFAESWTGRIPGAKATGEGALEWIARSDGGGSRWNPLSAWTVRRGESWELDVHGEWAVDGRYETARGVQRLQVSAGPVIDLARIRISSIKSPTAANPHAD